MTSPLIATGKNPLGPRKYPGRLVTFVKAWVPSQGFKNKAWAPHESMVRSQKLETEVAGLQARVKALEEENGELRDQADSPL